MADPMNQIESSLQSAKDTLRVVCPPLKSSYPQDPETFGDMFPSEPIATAYDYAVDRAVISVAQTAALAIQDAAEMMRNMSTEETVAIGVATAQWISNPENPVYENIIDKSMDNIKESANAFKAISQAAIDVLSMLNQ